MQVLHYFQLVADAGLVLSLIYLAARFTRSSVGYAQSKSEELHRSLSELIKEAERSGQDLNDRLLKRQGQLDRSLTELESFEKKIAKIELNVQDLIEQFATKEKIANDLLAKLENVNHKSTQSISSEAIIEPTTKSNIKLDAQPEPIINRVSDKSTSTVMFEFEDQADTLSSAIEKTTKNNLDMPVNIYGEPIVTQNKMSKLNDSIEREVEFNAGNEIEALETVYDAAEKLLKSGMDQKTVSAKTKLPLDEVKVLADIASKPNPMDDEAVKVNIKSSNKPLKPEDFESPQRVFSADEVVTNRYDNRLGVLGAMKRQRLTV
jgi:hypothetical protein